MSRIKNYRDLLSLSAIVALSGTMAASDSSKPNFANYARLLSFEANRGQADKKVDFLARGAGYSLFLSRGEAVLVMQSGTRKAESHTKWATVRMWPTGGNISARGEALEEQAGKSNYFIGNKPEQWRTGIPNYAKVRYRDVYPGVDLIYYGNQKQLEYDFVIAPGVDAGKIALEFEGASKAELDRSGDFVTRTSAGELRWHKPVAYQEINGSRKLVACDFVRKRAGELAFAIGAYDRSKPLVIDPQLVYSTYLGGSGSGDAASAIAVDAYGSAYVTGNTFSTDFPTKNPIQGSYLGTLNGSPNAFVTKFDAAGKLVYSTYLGGSGNSSGTEGDLGTGIAVDSHGNAYVTGFTGSPDFPTKNAFQGTLGGTCEPAPLCYTTNAFVTKLDAAGSELVYSTFLGGRSESQPMDRGNGIAVDGYGNAYVTGVTNSPDFPIKNAFQKELRGGTNAFVTKFDSAGTALMYSTFLGGTSQDSGNAIAVDAHNNAYLTGVTSSSDFPVKNAFQRTLKSANGNAFVTKFDPAGTALVYSTYLGGSGRTCRPSCGATGDSASGIAVDAHENAYIAGTATSLNFPVKNAFQPELKGRCYLCENAFLTKLDAAGNALIYSTYLGGGGEQGISVAVGIGGNAYVTGSTRSPEFPVKDAFQEKLACEPDHPCTEAFVTEFEAAGNALVFSSYLGGFGNSLGGDQGKGIAIDKSDNALVTGFTHSIDFPIKNAFQSRIESESGNAFVTKISPR